MIDHQVLKERLKDELDKMDLTKAEKNRLVDELNVLACILTEATQEKHGKP